MISSTLLLTTAFALANAAAPTATASAAKLEISGVPQDWTEFGLEIAAQQFANFRNSDVAHSDAVKVARDGFSLYLEQAPIQQLVSKAFEYYTNNAEAFTSLTWTPPSADFPLKAVQAFDSANKQLNSQPGYNSLTNYVKQHLSSFDLDAVLLDIHDLANVNPSSAHNAVAQIQSKIDENTYNKEAYSTAARMATEFAHEFGVDTNKIQQAWEKFSSIAYL